MTCLFPLSQLKLVTALMLDDHACPTLILFAPKRTPSGLMSKLKHQVHHAVHPKEWMRDKYKLWLACHACRRLGACGKQYTVVPPHSDRSSKKRGEGRV